MTIYLENAIIDNMVINAMLLFFVFKTIKQPVPRFRVFLAATAGTVFALLMPLFTFEGALLLLAKLFIGAVVVFIVQNKSFARFVLFYLIFIAYTFAFGGAIYGVMFALKGTESSLEYFMNNSSVPVGVLLLGVILVGALMRVLVKFLNVRHSINNLLRDVVIYYKDEAFKITSYLDTGNRLVDPKSNAPVVVISMSLFLKMFPDVGVDRIILQKLCGEQIADGHYINYSTVNSMSKMFVFAPQKIQIGRAVHDNVRLGLSMKGFRDAVKYDALLNAHLA